MSNLKLVGAAVLGGLLVLFAFQNMAPVELTFVFWTFESRRFVVILFSLVTGLVLGGTFVSMRNMFIGPPKAKQKTPES